jgi:chromosomal replication initiator protein
MVLRSAKEIWQTALGELQIQVTRPNFDTWLKDTVGISCRDDYFVIGTPNTFVAEWLENRLMSLVKKTLLSIIGRPIDIKFLVQAPEETEHKPAYAVQTDGGISSKSNKISKLSSFNHKYTFSQFVTGECNRLAYAAALEVAENPGQCYNPLFIYGATGLGKTHLLSAIEHTAREGGYRVLRTSAEQYTGEFVTALKSNQAEEFQVKYRKTEFLLFDDFQFLSGKAQTQECFFHVFNDLHDNSCQIVITSDKRPGDIPDLSDKLRSRLEGGLVADIRPPDEGTRLSVLNIKAKQAGASVPPEVIELVARHFRNNIRELEGGLNRVITHAKLSGEGLDITTAQKALAVLKPNGNSVPLQLTPEHIIEAVAQHQSVSAEALKGKRRDRKTAIARQIAMYLMREQNHCRLSEIGSIFGGRDHTTVLYSCEKITNDLSVNPQLSKTINEIRKALGLSCISQ